MCWGGMKGVYSSLSRGRILEQQEGLLGGQQGVVALRSSSSPTSRCCWVGIKRVYSSISRRHIVG